MLANGQRENDRPEHAEALARLLVGRHIHVNLIPLNPVSHLPDLRAPSGIATELPPQPSTTRGSTAQTRSAG